MRLDHSPPWRLPALAHPMAWFVAAETAPAQYEVKSVWGDPDVEARTRGCYRAVGSRV
jgi:hypothetical protein